MYKTDDRNTLLFRAEQNFSLFKPDVCESRRIQSGDFALFLQQPLGMLLFIGIPLTAFIIYDILHRQRYASREKTQAQEMEAELARLRSSAGETNPSSGESGEQ